jgi:4-hydroxybenzoate polyprenyltransferase
MKLKMSAHSDKNRKEGAFPLCIDLDGTLVKTDTLAELMLKLLKQNPLLALLFPLWLVGGKAHFKDQVSKRATLDVERLPYNEDLLAFLRKEHRAGRKLYLVTAAHENVAKAVCQHLGIFSSFYASDGTRNVSPERKAEQLSRDFGERSFDYAGNSRRDLNVWKRCARAILVGAPRGIEEKLHPPVLVARRIPNPRGGAMSLVQALRIVHWTKNLLIFLPLMMAHEWLDPHRLRLALMTFAAFSLCASGMYILNDLLDLEADRGHPDRKTRPFACGALSPWLGMVLAPPFVAAGLALGLGLSLRVLIFLLTYCVATFVYTLRIRQIVLVDVMLLAGLYSWRVITGGFATEVPLSPWFLAFSGFVFLSLAFLKRTSELVLLRDSRKLESQGRGYTAEDLEQIRIFGSVSAYLSILVLALYASSEEVRELYRRPEMLWLVCPVLLYWLSRLWLVADKGGIQPDPFLFALRDRVSYLAALAIILFIALAI